MALALSNRNSRDEGDFMLLKRLLAAVLIAFLSFANALFGAPTVDSTTPSSGPDTGGNIVTILGSGFTGATAVNFGSKSAIFAVISDNQINAVAPTDSIGTVDVTVTSPSGTSAATPLDYYTFTGDWTAYVTNISSDNVTPIDTATNTPGALIDVGGSPKQLSITPNNQTAYLSIFPNAAVQPLDLTTMPPTPGSLISVNEPRGSAITPDGSFVFVANDTNTVTPIDIATNTPQSTIAVGNIPVDIAITPNGLKAYVANNGSKNVTPINLTNRSPGTPISVVGNPQAIAITPDGQTAYVVGQGPDEVTPIDLNNNTTLTPISVGDAPFDIAISPNGTIALVTNANSNSVSVINLSNNSVSSTLTGFNLPIGVAITPDGKKGFVVNGGDNTVTPIDLTTNPPTIGTPIPTGGSDSSRIAITPDPAPAASFTVTNAPVGSPTTFNASASATAVGTIVSYVWNFGDGTTFASSSPIVTHTYTSAGPFTVTLTVTNSAGTSTQQVFTGQTMSRDGGPTATTSRTVTPVVFPPTPPTPPVLMPPTNLHGKQKKDRFLTQSELYNVITWSPPTSGPTPVSYEIFRDNALTDLIATVPADGVLTFVDHNRKKGVTYTYYIVSVDGSGNLSSPAFIAVSSDKLTNN